MENQLGDKIIQFRAKHNVSMEKFAKAVNLSTITIFNIENGKHKPRKITEIRILDYMKQVEE